MNRFFLKLQYDGSNYHGWQVQPNAHTVQQEIENALKKLFQTNIPIVGCGRTDTGVHAKEYYAHFDVKHTLDTQEVKYRLNAILPFSIAINNVLKVRDNAHARFDAILRGYEYHIHLEKNPFLQNWSWFFKENLNVDLMNKGCEILNNTTDFSSFSKLGSDNKTTICHIKQMLFVKIDNVLIFKVFSDRFLRNMVRALVGTLVDLGRGKINLDDLQNIIESKNRSMAGSSVPAHGLYLTHVEYNSDIFATK